MLVDFILQGQIGMSPFLIYYTKVILITCKLKAFFVIFRCESKSCKVTRAGADFEGGNTTKGH